MALYPMLPHREFLRCITDKFNTTPTALKVQFKDEDSGCGMCVCGSAVVQLGSPVTSNTSRSRCTCMHLVILSVPPDTVILNGDMHMVTLEPTLCRIHIHIHIHIITTITTAASHTRT